jgi:predicted RNA-binding protein with PIN domain
MLYVVDGHNLIPHLPGFSLRQLDDEERLVALLQVFTRVRRQRVEVFFDAAPPGQAGPRNYGAVKAHFVHAGRTADDAIRAYLRRLGARAAQVTLVSSDHQVRAEAHALHAQLLDSPAFAALLIEAQRQAATAPGPSSGSSLPPDEVEEWLRLFGEK